MANKISLQGNALKYHFRDSENITPSYARYITKKEWDSEPKFCGKAYFKNITIKPQNGKFCEFARALHRTFSTIKTQGSQLVTLCFYWRRERDSEHSPKLYGFGVQVRLTNSFTINKNTPRVRCAFVYGGERGIRTLVRFWRKLISSQPRYDHFDISPYILTPK